MKIIWSVEIDNVLKCGRSLEKIGVQNWALEKEQALAAIFKFTALQIPILGGDVCEFMDGILQYNLDSWHCDQLLYEPKIDFVARSLEQAKQYIEGYKSITDRLVFFAFVPGG